MLTITEAKWVLNASVIKLLVSTILLSIASPLLIAKYKGWFIKDGDEDDDCCILSKKD